MKTSLSLRLLLLLLLLLLLPLSLILSQVQGIRLEKGFSSARHQEIQVVEDSPIKITRNGGLVREVTLCRDGHCSSGTVKRRFSKVAAKKIHHWLPRIHEDYYGPRSHKPKHY